MSGASSAACFPRGVWCAVLTPFGPDGAPGLTAVGAARAPDLRRRRRCASPCSEPRARSKSLSLGERPCGARLVAGGGHLAGADHGGHRMRVDRGDDRAHAARGGLRMRRCAGIAHVFLQGYVTDEGVYAVHARVIDGTGDSFDLGLPVSHPAGQWYLSTTVIEVDCRLRDNIAGVKDSEGKLGHTQDLLARFPRSRSSSATSLICPQHLPRAARKRSAESQTSFHDCCGGSTTPHLPEGSQEELARLEAFIAVLLRYPVRRVQGFERTSAAVKRWIAHLRHNPGPSSTTHAATRAWLAAAAPGGSTSNATPPAPTDAQVCAAHEALATRAIPKRCDRHFVVPAIAPIDARRAKSFHKGGHHDPIHTAIVHSHSGAGYSGASAGAVAERTPARSR